MRGGDVDGIDCVEELIEIPGRKGITAGSDARFTHEACGMLHRWVVRTDDGHAADVRGLRHETPSDPARSHDAHMHFGVARVPQCG